MPGRTERFSSWLWRVVSDIGRSVERGGRAPGGGADPPRPCGGARPYRLRIVRMGTPTPRADVAARYTTPNAATVPAATRGWTAQAAPPTSASTSPARVGTADPS